MLYKCFLCNSKENNDVELGEFMHLEEISVHYFCLLLGSGICQSGEDDEGILGFIREDIEKERRRVLKQVCCYCNKSNANISCCDKSCHKHFHLPCGIKANFLNCFVDTFQSFCDKHHKLSTKIKHKPTEICTICYDAIGTFHPVTSIQSPCCQSGWFHKKCLMNFAKTAGYFFKCPLCNNDSVFREAVPFRGIFIPDKDASWELEPNAFVDLLERPNKCEICKEEPTTRSKKLVLCDNCGSYGAHKKCWIDMGNTESICPICMEIEKRFDGPNDSTPNNISVVTVNSSGENSSSSMEFQTIATRSNRRSRKQRKAYDTSTSEEKCEIKIVVSSVKPRCLESEGSTDSSDAKIKTNAKNKRKRRLRHKSSSPNDIVNTATTTITETRVDTNSNEEPFVKKTKLSLSSGLSGGDCATKVIDEKKTCATEIEVISVSESESPVKKCATNVFPIFSFSMNKSMTKSTEKTVVRRRKPLVKNDDLDKSREIMARFFISSAPSSSSHSLIATASDNEDDFAAPVQKSIILKSKTTKKRQSNIVTEERSAFKQICINQFFTK